MPDLTAKARRAAEWFKAKHPGKVQFVGCYCQPWVVVTETGDEAGEWECSDSQLIKDAEQAGWQDEQEADGVEWDMKTEAASYGELVLVVERFEDRWEWKVQEIFGDVLYPASGTAPTRAEARAAAVEAARGMG